MRNARTWNPRTAAAIGLLAVAGLLASGCQDDDSGNGASGRSDTSGTSGTSGAEGEAGKASAIKWGVTCPQPSMQEAADSERAERLRCGTLRVPLDYDRPAGEQIKLLVTKVAADDKKQRRGVLLTNPGGPGDASFDFSLQLDGFGAPDRLFDAYDVISFDPRGVGHSSPLSCGFTDPGKAMSPTYAHGDDDVAKMGARGKKLAEQCRKKLGERQYHFTTANTARDMDRIRAALGEKKISYYGRSYGTYLGALYAELHPQRLDRAVFDSSMGSDYGRSAMRSWGRAMELRFPEFGAWAAERDKTYHLGKSAAAVRALNLKIADGLRKHPQPGLDESTFRFLSFQGLSRNVQFPYLAKLHRALAEKDAKAAGKAAEGMMALDHAIPDKSIPADNGASLTFNILCNDRAWPRSLKTYQRDTATDRKRYPLIGGMAANVMPCAYWEPPKEKPLTIGDKGPRNQILIVQNLRDPKTEVATALTMRKSLGGRARMVTVNQGGHGVYAITENRCANRAITARLVDGKMPAHDTVCAK